MGNMGWKTRGAGPMPAVRGRMRRGMTLVEVVVGLTLLVIGVLGYLHVIVGSVQGADVHRERTRALDAARAQLERLKAVPIAEVLARFDEDEENDPEGPGTAPGPFFDVPGLDALPGAPGGAVGRILFPQVDGALREDTDWPQFGLPRDLNGDGVVDDEDRSEDYRILPVRVRIEWRGASGPTQIELGTILGGP